MNRKLQFIKNVIVAAIVMFQCQIALADVVCNKFEVYCSLSGYMLEMTLDTDLPGNAVIIYSVSRSYKIKGNLNSFSVEYLKGKSTVEKLKKKRIVSVKHEEWQEALKFKQDLLSSMGQGFEISEIGYKIEVYMALSTNQPEVMFGFNNEHLKGRAVKMNKRPTVDSLIFLPYPIDEEEIQEKG